MKTAGYSLPITPVARFVITMPATILQSICSTLTKPVLYSLIFMLIGTGFAVAAEIDDSSLFVDAFSAYQKKDYLLTIEKIGIIDQLFPDTPLRDVALLLQARAALKSGDHELAAITINRFYSEFPANPLTSTIEKELLSLGVPRQKGEKPPPAIHQRTAARTVRNEQMTPQSMAPEMITQQRPGDSAEQGRQIPELYGADSRKPGRTDMPKAALEPAKAFISFPGGVHTVAIGQQGEIPFEVYNPGTADEDFILELSAPPEYGAVLAEAGKPDKGMSPITIAGAALFKGRILFRMPQDRIDGYKATLLLRAVSEKFPHGIQTSEVHIITAAPLLRAVAKPERQNLEPGEQTRYRVTILNAGTLPTREMTVRVYLPAQLEFLESGSSAFVREDSETVTFRIDTLRSGKLVELSLAVRVREDSPVGLELRSRVEVFNHQLQTKESFTSVAVHVQAKQPLMIP